MNGAESKRQNNEWCRITRVGAPEDQACKKCEEWQEPVAVQTKTFQIVIGYFTGTERTGKM